MKFSLARIVLAAIFALSAAFAVAQTPAPERRVALVIGNAAYEGGPLPNPANDARLMANVLRGLGFDVDLVLDAGYLEMQRSIRRFGDRAQGAGVAMFYYAGHGLQLGGTNMLVPVDARLVSERDARAEAVELRGVIDVMRAAGARTNVIVLDACRDNPLIRTGGRAAALGAGTGLAPMSSPNSLIVFSTEPGAVSVDGAGENSPFTAALARHIVTRDMEARQMLTRVRQDVRAATGDRQTPWDHSSLIEDFYFLGGPPRPERRPGEASIAGLGGTRGPAGPVSLAPGLQGPRPFVVDEVPFVAPENRRLLAEYQRAQGTRALALATNGVFAWRVAAGTREADLRREALESCEYMARQPCAIYAINEQVVAAESGLVSVLRLAPGAFDPAQVPFLSETQRAALREMYAAQAPRRALAISPTGAWAAAWGMDDDAAARGRAVARCEELDGRRGLCFVYAIGDRVVAAMPN